MRLVLSLALLLSIAAVPSPAAAQLQDCEGCSGNDCVRSDRPSDCWNWHKVGSCDCGLFCDCTGGTECSFCGGQAAIDLGHTKELLGGGWEVSGVRLSDETFSVLAACGAQVDVVYTAAGEARRRELARLIEFSAVEDRGIVGHVARVLSDALGDWLL